MLIITSEKYSDNPLLKEITRKLQLLAGIEPYPQKWESTTFNEIYKIWYQMTTGLIFTIELLSS